MSKFEAYTIDSIALLGYLADRLPTKVDEIFKRAEDEDVWMMVPSIVVGETLFTLLKGREVFGRKIPLDKLMIFLDAVETSRTMHLMDLNIKGWKLVLGINLPELHDRMVVAIYKLSESMAILTDDEEIRGLKDVKTIWE
ncbi:MAG: hypothetical protein AOA65_0605 [Candidatus Bathyarchaeota archaeon BA1]|nr:MAG: hypothetical protein AOA65_0605 [Candidatus Bathyarchaeota archaeon BA1]